MMRDDDAIVIRFTRLTGHRTWAAEQVGEDEVCGVGESMELALRDLRAQLVAGRR